MKIVEVGILVLLQREPKYSYFRLAALCIYIVEPNFKSRYLVLVNIFYSEQSNYLFLENLGG